MLKYINMKNDIEKHIDRPLRLQSLPEELRRRIKEARTRRGWSQRRLGVEVGLPQPHVSAIEAGGVVPRFDTLLDVVRVLDMDLMLVPRPLVAAVQSLIRAHGQPGSDEKPLYAVGEDETDYEIGDRREI
jgi:transcriptional regulator with XRE-family HTH domain